MIFKKIDPSPPKRCSFSAKQDFNQSIETLKLYMKLFMGQLADRERNVLNLKWYTTPPYSSDQ